MQRLIKDERGAVAIIVALVMVVLLGFAALAIDISAAWSEKKQLQNGADAGALAIAQTCAKAAVPCTIASTTPIAGTYAAANRNSGTATGKIIFLDPSKKVTVEASEPHMNWFAQVINGGATTPVGARASAAWGVPVKGGTFPLTFSYCEWAWQQAHGGLDGGVDQIIHLSKHSGSDCTGPSGLPLPGGFGWVDPNAGSCKESSIINGWYTSDTGNTPPGSCNPSDFDALIGTTILIPIFDQAKGTGSHGEYHIYGYAAFTFTGYYFAGTYKGTKICTGADRCISGHFTKYVTLDEALELGPGPSLGASIVTLTD